MKSSEVRDILNKHKPALVIGNGINLYGETGGGNSWLELLQKLATNHKAPQTDIPQGISLTEFYDVLDIANGGSSSMSESKVVNLQQEFCDLMRCWRAENHHKRVALWARSNQRPILTTNFEDTLGSGIDCKLKHTTTKAFTDYYPWTSYYGDSEIDDPIIGFGIWHINGMQHYSRSIRLELSHYMGSVEKARKWLHKGKDDRLFSEKNHSRWQGHNTWLHVVFNCPLLIFGLKLEENEVFLRWLLIERARYFKKFPDRKKAAWYVHTSNEKADGKFFFLKGVGVELVKVNSYDHIYGQYVWEASATKRPSRH